MKSTLVAILGAKRIEIEALRAEAKSIEDRVRRIANVLGPAERSDARSRRVAPAEALRRPVGGPLRLLAEIKRRSPSAGPLSTVLSPADRALAYARSGATMISVLCDAQFFDGSWDHLAEVRTALDDARLPVPLLAKEFVLDEVQISQARARGADAVLLIARIVEARRLAELVEASRSAGLEPLVEVVSEDELRAALDAHATIIGVNARDLDTLEMDLERTARLVAQIPPACVAVHLSGLKAPENVAAVSRTRADAALVGEALMRQDDPTSLLLAMCTAASDATPRS
jgi:indole-3-glycerol phosphate synthase